MVSKKSSVKVLEKLFNNENLKTRVLDADQKPITTILEFFNKPKLTGSNP